MCFSDGLLSLSHDLEGRVTRGFWLNRDEKHLSSVIEGITPSTPYIRHPFFIPRQILHDRVRRIELSVNRTLSELGQVRGDVDQAIGNDWVDGFEYYFYRANKRYFHAIGDLWLRFDQPENLGSVIQNGPSDLSEGLVPDDQVDFEDTVNFDMERLRCFRWNIETIDAGVKRQLGLVSTQML